VSVDMNWEGSTPNTTMIPTLTSPIIIVILLSIYVSCYSHILQNQCFFSLNFSVRMFLNWNKLKTTDVLEKPQQNQNCTLLVFFSVLQMWYLNFISCKVLLTWSHRLLVK